jgi:hypothetical protein
MKNLAICMMVMLLPATMLVGCGNVYLRGEALTGVETSTLDAYQAACRTGADPNVPAWQTAYQQENFRQWRFFVRSARKDLAWGPKLEGE